MDRIEAVPANKRTLKLLTLAFLPLLLISIFLVYRSYRSDRADQEAKSSVRHAAVAAQAFGQRHGNFDDLNPRSIAEIDSHFDYRDSRTPASGYRSASIFGSGGQFAAAAYGGSGTCFWIQVSRPSPLSSAQYASAKTPLNECVADRYLQLNFRDTSMDGWEK